MLTFIKSRFFTVIDFSEPFGEIVAMIDLLKKFTQLLTNDFAQLIVWVNMVGAKRKSGGQISRRG